MHIVLGKSLAWQARTRHRAPPRTPETPHSEPKQHEEKVHVPFIYSLRIYFIGMFAASDYLR